MDSINGRSQKYFRALATAYRALSEDCREMTHALRVYNWMVQIERRRAGLPKSESRVTEHVPGKRLVVCSNLDPHIDKDGNYSPPLNEELSLAALYHDILKWRVPRPSCSDIEDPEKRGAWRKELNHVSADFALSSLLEAGYMKEAIWVSKVIFFKGKPKDYFDAEADERGVLERLMENTRLLNDADILDFLTFKLGSPEWYVGWDQEKKREYASGCTSLIAYPASLSLLSEHDFREDDEAGAFIKELLAAPKA